MAASPQSPSQGQHRILVVEDEAMVAMLLEDMLLDLGLEMVGPLARLPDAVERARSETFDAAILDVNLAGQETYPVADVLIERGIPFVFATGYGASSIRDDYRERPILQKPFQQSDLKNSMAALGFG